jgi:hypothetical protein
MRKFATLFVLLSLIFGFTVTSLWAAEPPEGRWSVEKVNAWYAKQPWLVGCNFIPSTAINQLEMWQADTFDMKTIERELDLAKGLGFNTLRVYLHDLAYDQDPEGFLDRVDQFLEATSKRGIRPVLVFFDDCWLVNPKIGKQPEPWPGVHNSGWLESPGLPLLKKYPNDPKLQKRLKLYVQTVLKRFGQDDRVLMWDLYNEPGSGWKERGEAPTKYRAGSVGDICLPLLRDVFAWSREISPPLKQPITACEFGSKKVCDITLNQSDVITFHDYTNPERLEKHIQRLEKQVGGRPMICTEYMARHRDSRFETCLPVFAKYNIGAINWGFVAGKTNTHYPWSSWRKPGKLPEPDLWFHDIYRADGTPFSQKEIDAIRKTIKEKRSK